MTPLSFENPLYSAVVPLSTLSPFARYNLPSAVCERSGNSRQREEALSARAAEVARQEADWEWEKATVAKAMGGNDLVGLNFGGG